MFFKTPTKFEIMRIQIRHPHFSSIEQKNDGITIAINESDEDDLRYASSQGWEVKASTSLELPNEKSAHIEIVTLQRSDLHPKFNQKTFTDAYLEESNKTFKERKELYS